MPTIKTALSAGASRRAGDRPACSRRGLRLTALLPSLPLLLIAALHGYADPVNAAATSEKRAGNLSRITVSWIPPSQRQDGSALGMTEIAAYRVHYGPSSGKYTDTLTITDAYDTDVILRKLARGQTVYVVVEAVDQSGLASGPSEELAVRIDY